MRPSDAPVRSASRERLYRIVFGLAALYNLAFGLWVALWPAQFFLLCGVPPPVSPALWQCIAMMVTVYAPAYLYAALRPWSARPLIAVALLGKLLGPIGWLGAVRAGDLSVATFPLVAMNDIAWWAPFALFLVDPTRLGARLRATVPWTCALTHAAAALWTASFLQEGLHGAPAERLAFVEAHVSAWRVGWALWMVAALSFVAFIGWWAARVRGALAVVAFGIATLGLACDLAAGAVTIGWISTRGATVFEVGRLLSFVLAHTGYVIAGALLTLADRSLAPPLRRVAWCIWALGATAEACVLLDYPALTDVLFGAMFVLLLPWTVLVGRARKAVPEGLPLRDLVPKHPLPMRCRFRECYLVNFAVDPATLRRVLPPPLEPDLYAGKAWLSIVIADMVRMRPAFLPPRFGSNYTQVVYRAVVRAGRERGVFFVRSDADNPWICLAGDLLTRFRFHRAEARWTRRTDCVSFELAARAGHAADIQASFRVAAASCRLPPGSAFRRLDDARDFLVELFQAFSVDAITGSVDRVRIERAPWDVQVVPDDGARYEFMQGGSVFNSANARLDSVFRMEDVPYHWHTLAPAFAAVSREQESSANATKTRESAAANSLKIELDEAIATDALKAVFARVRHDVCIK